MRKRGKMKKKSDLISVPKASCLSTIIVSCVLGQCDKVSLAKWEIDF